MNINDAMDAVDLYGPDPDLWPRAERPALEAMLQADEDFADYVRDVKRIDDLLANWDESDDGAGIDFGEEDGESEPETPSDYDRDDHEDEDEGQNEDDNDDVGLGTKDEDEGQDEEEEQVIERADQGIDLDPDQLKDMDDMFSSFIRKIAENSDPTEFRVFTRDFDEMVDIVAPDHTDLERIEQAVAQATGPLQKDMRRMIAARTQAKRLPGKRSGRLHAPNLHRIMSGDDRVFFRKEAAPELDTAISLLIDCSGSMNGERMKLATEASYALASVLNRLAVSFEILGFTDRYQDARMTKEYMKEVAEADAIAKIIRANPITMPKFKTFDERWSAPVQRRFGHVFNNGGYNSQCGIEMGSTPEGCGIEFAARRLVGRNEKRKMMIVMTDGEPGGHVYHGQSAGDYQAYKHQSEKMVRSVAASGIDIVGMGIQHGGVADYYPDYMVIQNLAEMPKLLMTLLKKFMVS